MRLRPVLAWVMLVAGFTAVVGSFLPWAYVDFPVSGSSKVSGSLVSDLFTAFFGVVIAGYAVPAVRGDRLPARETVFSVGAGLVLFALGLWDSRHLTSMTAALVAADTGTTIGPGLWMCMIGGLLGALAATGLAFRESRAARRSPSVPGGRAGARADR
ncbi:hypothetical protein Acy02nite_15020 [Actinoplanes cyaneus]|uniref:Uncharacterized protein n=1 Tax=Actinoplanes cyaneus TaxID=52696 RepID=A0A919MA25_9ACTN|nr:hypothetical protein [Actinoplanes cyaneus]MCW2137573.1 hypothetical protein [Actinoplanes cyaneus]GID63621.1 hypothetical protein Acy02nite_15020 [Actinoplanes cyaneus]